MKSHKDYHKKTPQRSLLSSCPQWVHQQYDLNETQVRRYYNPHNHRTLIAIGPQSSLIPNQFGGVDEQWFILWYDEKGHFVTQTTNVIPNHLQFVGRCVIPKFWGTRDPNWLFTQFPANDYSILKYKHRYYGIIYSITPKRITDSGTVWYDSNGQFLYRSPMQKWDKLASHQRCADYQWNRSISFIERCGSN